MKIRVLEASKGHRWVLCVALLLLLSASAASAQVLCDESVRESYITAVEEGLDDDMLEAMFGHCREDIDEEEEDPLGGVSFMTAKMLRSNKRFERINKCGYHSQNRVVSCDVEIRRSRGYRPAPTGSLEYVLVCLDCNNDNVFEFSRTSRVHVNDRIAGRTFKPPWFFSVSVNTVAAGGLCNATDQLETNMRAILSWATPPQNCGTVPRFGNVRNFKARRDP